MCVFFAHAWLTFSNGSSLPLVSPLRQTPRYKPKFFRTFWKSSRRYRTTTVQSKSQLELLWIFRICKPEALIEEFLTKEVNFFYFPPAHQKEILWDLTKLQLQNLTIRGSSSINTKNLEDFLENHTLQHVSIIECSGVVESDIEAIHAKCNTLDKNRTMNIIFENCENLSARVGELRYEGQVTLYIDLLKGTKTSRFGWLPQKPWTNLLRMNYCPWWRKCTFWTLKPVWLTS